MTRTLSRPELLAWTRLARTPRIGPLTFHRLIVRFRTAAAALEALPRISNLTATAEERAATEIEGVEALGARLIASIAGASFLAVPLTSGTAKEN